MINVAPKRKAKKIIHVGIIFLTNLKKNRILSIRLFSFCLRCLGRYAIAAYFAEYVALTTFHP